MHGVALLRVGGQMFPGVVRAPGGNGTKAGELLELVTDVAMGAGHAEVTGQPAENLSPWLAPAQEKDP